MPFSRSSESRKTRVTRWGIALAAAVVLLLGAGIAWVLGVGHFSVLEKTQLVRGLTTAILCVLILTVGLFGTGWSVTASAVWAGLCAATVALTAVWGMTGQLMGVAAAMLTLLLVAGRRAWRGGLGSARRPLVTFCLMLLGAVLSIAAPALIAAHENACRKRCLDNLHRIAVALWDYHDRYGRFPPAVTTDGQGQAMHGWAVRLLPFLGQQALYDAYDFSQPWNAPANAKVVNTCLKEFLCPSAGNRGEPVSHYSIIVCPGSVCGMDRSVAVHDIHDGTSQTVVAVETVYRPVPWASPEAIVDFGPDTAAPRALPQDGRSLHGPGAFIAFVDGRVRVVRQGADKKVLATFCTAAGGEVGEGSCWGPVVCLITLPGEPERQFTPEEWSKRIPFARAFDDL